MDVTKLSPIKVGGFAFKVIDDSEVLNAAGLVGQTRTMDVVIALRAGNVPDSYVTQSALHEVLHAIADIYMETEQPNESTIASMSQGLFQVLRDNPKLVKAITEAK